MRHVNACELIPYMFDDSANSALSSLSEAESSMPSRDRGGHTSSKEHHILHKAHILRKPRVSGVMWID